MSAPTMSDAFKLVCIYRFLKEEHPNVYLELQGYLKACKYIEEAKEEEDTAPLVVSGQMKGVKFPNLCPPPLVIKEEPHRDEGRLMRKDPPS